MEDSTILLIAAVGAGIALSGGLSKTGEGIASVGDAVDIATSNVTGVIPWIEGEVDQFEGWLGGLFS